MYAVHTNQQTTETNRGKIAAKFNGNTILQHK